MDIVDIARFEVFAKNFESKFCKRVFTPYELEYLKPKKAASMAGLFAAKEAVAKALGTGFRGISPIDIEIKHNKLGAPEVNLHGKAKVFAKNAKMLVSISHTKDVAIAIAFYSKA